MTRSLPDVTEDMLNECLDAYWDKRQKWTPAAQLAMRNALSVAFRLADEAKTDGVSEDK